MSSPHPVLLSLRGSLRAAALAVAFVALAACAPRATPPAPSPAPAPAAGREPTRGALPSIAAATAGLERRDGFVPVYVGDPQGRTLLELPRDSTRALLFTSMATGLGSNPIGIDRGMSGEAYVARFDRSGERVLVVLENWGYRSSASDNAPLARSVAESFPPSTVAALPLVAAEGGRLLVDGTELLLRDWSDVAGTLERAGEGRYTLARDRSAAVVERTRAFPSNTELESALTFTLAGGEPGRIVRGILPDARAVTLRQHLSLVALPDSGYQPRRLDPRVGYFGITVKDYAQPIQQPLEQRWIARQRLERVTPADPTSPIARPIVYYVDRGIPEPIRTAVVQGAGWWAQAFERAGLPGAFQVRDLPDSVDAGDARYNVVQWVNRNERGWSVGGSLGDPRTGEIVKAMVRLDSHRARTDYNLYAGLMGADSSTADTAFVLARIRQLAAHEVGHTLGLAHNYIASTYGRGSVMDYPAPRVQLAADGSIDLSEAYAAGPGPYDVWAIRWGYGIFPPGTERDSLRAIVAEGLGRGYLFLSDADARPENASDPRTNLWDDAATPEEFLRRQMAVRRVALARFGERNIRTGEPLALLQERFAPVYFMHRFALGAVTRAVGGMEYANAVRGDAVQATRPVAAGEQRAALALLMQALRPEALAIPDTVLTLLGPRPFSYERSVELFGSRTRPEFDELGAARTLAQMIVDGVLQRERAARLVLRAAHAPDALSLAEVVDSLARSWRDRAPAAPMPAALTRVVQRALADRLIALAADDQAAPQVRAVATLELTELGAVARRRARAGSSAERAHWLAIATDFDQWLTRGVRPEPTPALTAPLLEPFGSAP